MNNLLAPTPILPCVTALLLALAGCGSAPPDEGSAGDWKGPATSPNGLPLPPDGGAPAAGPAPTTGSFIAFQRDFQGFVDWTRIDLPSPAPIGDGVIHHGQRVVYVNRMPESGSTVFPTGTVIVKTMETGEVLARVKRGGDYNRSGSVGWEWFELSRSGSDWVIVWRGITPPAGFCYGGIVGGACNECHRVWASNDFVATGALELGKL